MGMDGMDCTLAIFGSYCWHILLLHELLRKSPAALSPLQILIYMFVWVIVGVGVAPLFGTYFYCRYEGVAGYNAIILLDKQLQTSKCQENILSNLFCFFVHHLPLSFDFLLFPL
jgi:hypothetical protein